MVVNQQQERRMAYSNIYARVEHVTFTEENYGRIVEITLMEEIQNEDNMSITFEYQ